MVSERERNGNFAMDGDLCLEKCMQYNSSIEETAMDLMLTLGLNETMSFLWQAVCIGMVMC